MRGTAVGLLLTLLLGVTPGAAARPADARRPLVVTGYAMGGLSPRVIPRDAHGLDLVGVSGIGVKPDGSGVTGTYRQLTALRRQAHRYGLRAELLMSNWSPVTGDFDPALATALLSDPDHRAAAVRRLDRIARTEQWDGITVDLEALRPRDRDDLVAFVSELRAALPARVELSMDIGARPSIAAYRRSGFDLGRLARHVDRIALMTYDQHGSGWSGPGPVGGLPWQRRTMKVLLSRVPAGLVDLGVAGYGYTWPSSGTGHSLSPRHARALVAGDGARAVWHRRQGEWSAALSDGTVVWWSDARSYRLRLALARGLGVHGVALWVLGSADPLP